MASSDDTESLLKEENGQSLTLSAPAIQTEGQGISLYLYKIILGVCREYFRSNSYYPSWSVANTIIIINILPRTKRDEKNKFFDLNFLIE